MKTPGRVALTAIFGVLGTTIPIAVLSGLSEPVNALMWQLSYLLPSALVGPALFLLSGLILAVYLGLVGYFIAHIWSKRK